MVNEESSDVVMEDAAGEEPSTAEQSLIIPITSSSQKDLFVEIFPEEMPDTPSSTLLLSNTGGGGVPPRRTPWAPHLRRCNFNRCDLVVSWSTMRIEYGLVCLCIEVEREAEVQNMK